MLDGIASAIEGALQANSIVGVAGYFLSPAVRFVHDGFQFVHGKRGLRNKLSLSVHPRPVRHVNLDPIGPMIQLLTRSLAGFDGPIHDLRALRNIELWSVVLEVVSSGCGYGPRCAKKPRSRNCALLDGLLDFNIAVARALRLQVAKSRESLFERAADGKSGTRSPERDARFQYVDVVAALGGILSPEEDVCVGVNQAGQHRGVG